MDSTLARNHEKLRDSYDIIHKHLLKSMNAYAIVLSILFTTSYSGFLQPPKPFNSSVPQTNSSTWQKLFIYFNGSALFSSVAGLLFFGSSSFSPLLALDTRQSPPSAELEVQKCLALLANLLPKFFYVIFFLGVSLTSSVLGYISAGFSTVRSTWTEQIAVFVPAVVGGFVYIQALFVCISDISQLIHDSIRQNTQLWAAMKNGTWFGLCLVQYIDLVFCESRVSAPGHQNPSTPTETEENAAQQSANGNAPRQENSPA